MEAVKVSFGSKNPRQESQPSPGTATYSTKATFPEYAWRSQLPQLLPFPVNENGPRRSRPMMKLLGHFLASGYSDQTKQAGAEELDGWG